MYERAGAEEDNGREHTLRCCNGLEARRIDFVASPKGELRTKHSIVVEFDVGQYCYIMVKSRIGVPAEVISLSRT